MNKDSGSDRIPSDLFKILKDNIIICQQIWKAQQWPQHWKRSAFLSILKKGNAKES